MPRWEESGRQDWETPQALFDVLDAEFAFTLDAAADEANAKCARFLTENDNALVRAWSGRVFLNPPYGPSVREVPRWVCKVAREIRRRGGPELVVALLGARIETAWFHDYVWAVADEVRIPRGRYRHELLGVEHGTGKFPSIVVVWRRRLLCRMEHGPRVSTMLRFEAPL